MAKRIALLDFISCDGVTLSSWFRQIGITNEDERVDVSGFSTTGSSEFLQGTRTQSISAEIFVGRGATETQDILYPLYRDRTTFEIVWRPTADAVSSTNPEWRGNVKLFAWPEGANRGEVEVASVTFEAADATGIVLAYS